MKFLFKTVLVIFTFVFSTKGQKTETIYFLTEDSLKITADTYIAHEHKTTPFIVLFHQAGWSRGEYIEIAPKLNKLGFNCMAIDQRSGKNINGIENETFKRAEAKGLETKYHHTLPDLLAAIKYARNKFANGKLIIWGSSYSAGLVLKVAGDYPDLVDGVVAFAPGNYFVRYGQPQDWINKSAKNIKVPVFFTSSRDEEPRWRYLYDAIKNKDKLSYVPQKTGHHGSRALWTKFSEHKSYWNAVIPFLNKFILREE